MENEPAPVEEVVVRPSEPNPVPPGPIWTPNPLGRLIATHNPFYAISAALVFYGLRASFSASGTLSSAVLMACLAAYALLLTTTAIWLRRLGALWEDVRMLALLVLLLLLSISVTFDDTLLAQPQLGRGYFLGGWLFAALVCEALLHGLHVRLPASYRVPFHALLALFFLYPLGAAQRVAGDDETALGWYLFGFASTAAAILLTLLPAVWRGPRVVENNGTPWRWPLYPLTLFVFLTVGVVGRAYYLCYSFSTAPDGQSIFGVYFLMPLAWAVALLVLVGVVRHALPAVAMRMLVLPLGWLALTSVVPSKMSYDPTYGQFLRTWMETINCGPAAVGVIAAAVFYGIAWALRVPGAFGGLIAALSGMSLIYGPAQSVLDRQPALAAPFLVATLLVWAEGLRRRSSWLCSCGSLMVTLLVAVWLTRRGEPATLFFAYHALLALLSLVGLIFYGEKGSGVRALVVLMLLLSGTNAVLLPTDGLFASIPLWATYYPWLAMVALVAAGYLFREFFGYSFAVALLLQWLALHSVEKYLWLRQYVPGLDAIVLGLVAFALAVNVSLIKSRRSETVTAEEKPPSVVPPAS